MLPSISSLLFFSAGQVQEILKKGRLDYVVEVTLDLGYLRRPFNEIYRWPTEVVLQNFAHQMYPFPTNGVAASRTTTTTHASAFQPQMASLCNVRTIDSLCGLGEPLFEGYQHKGNFCFP